MLFISTNGPIQDNYKKATSKIKMIYYYLFEFKSYNEQFYIKLNQKYFHPWIIAFFFCSVQKLKLFLSWKVT